MKRLLLVASSILFFGLLSACKSPQNSARSAHDPAGELGEIHAGNSAGYASYSSGYNSYSSGYGSYTSAYNSYSSGYGSYSDGPQYLTKNDLKNAGSFELSKFLALDEKTRIQEMRAFTTTVIDINLAQPDWRFKISQEEAKELLDPLFAVGMMDKSFEVVAFVLVLHYAAIQSAQSIDEAMLLQMIKLALRHSVLKPDEKDVRLLSSTWLGLFRRVSAANNSADVFRRVNELMASHPEAFATLSFNQIVVLTGSQQKVFLKQLIGQIKTDAAVGAIIQREILDLGLYHFVEQAGLAPDYLAAAGAEAHETLKKAHEHDPHGLVWKNARRILLSLSAAQDTQGIDHLAGDPSSDSQETITNRKLDNAQIKPALDALIQNLPASASMIWKYALSKFYLYINKSVSVPLLHSMDATHQLALVDAIGKSLLTEARMAKILGSLAADTTLSADVRVIVQLLHAPDAVDVGVLLASFNQIIGANKQRVSEFLTKHYYLLKWRDIHVLKKYFQDIISAETSEGEKQFYQGLLSKLPSIDEDLIPERVDVITKGLEYWVYKDKKIARLVVDPKELDLVIAHTDSWNNAKTVETFIAETNAIAGINGGFWHDSNDSNLSWLLRKTVSSYQYGAKPIGMLKARKNIISDSPDYWAVIGWTNAGQGEAPQVFGGDVKTKWFLNPRSLNLKVERREFMPWAKVSVIEVTVQGRTHYVVIAENRVAGVVDTREEIEQVSVRKTNSWFGGSKNEVIGDQPFNFFALTTDKKSLIDTLKRETHIVFEPQYYTPINEDHSTEDGTHSIQFSHMEQMISGQPFIVRNGKRNLSPVKPDSMARGVWNTVWGYDSSRATLCFLKDGRWALSVYESQDIVPLAVEHEAMGCIDAINLDGDGSSQLIVKGDSAKKFNSFDRPISDAILVVPKKT